VLVQGFAARGVPPAGANVTPAQAPTATEVSRLDGKHLWQSRSDGVYSSDDAAKSWRRIYPQPANAVVRLSLTAGVIDVPSSPGRCMCATRKLWTTDAGRSWHRTTLIADHFTGAGKSVYWWAGGTLHALVNFPGKATRTRTILNVANGTVVDAVAVPGGVIALISYRVNGLGWDNSPRLAVIRDGRTQTISLPTRSGNILARTIRADGSDLTVSAVDYSSNPISPVTWHSTNGGTSWSSR
jgi:hypothetical protein